MIINKREENFVIEGREKKKKEQNSLRCVIIKKLVLQWHDDKKIGRFFFLNGETFGELGTSLDSL